MGGILSSCTRSLPDPGPEPLIRLTYTSKIVATHEDAADEIVASVLASALRNNPGRHVSGILYFDRATRSVLQVLEGPLFAVLGLYAVIKVDRRHRDCILLEQRKVEERAYSAGDFGGMILSRDGGGAIPRMVTMTKQGQSIHTSPFAGVHLVRLQYSSFVLAADADEGRRIIKQILECAMPFNAVHSIGGLLCYNPSTLAVTQILEGPPETVMSLFDRILIDARHRNVVLTSQEGAIARPLDSLILFTSCCCCY